jgi:hypothetical protein
VEGLWRTITHLGYVTDHTMHQHAEDSVLRVKDFVEPRIEPEVMFGLKGAPLPRMSEAALLDCIEWVALGYEVVQRFFPAGISRPPMQSCEWHAWSAFGWDAACNGAAKD